MIALYQLSVQVAQMHGAWGHHGGMWMLAPFLVLLWAGAAVAGWFLLRAVLGRGHARADRALDILAERLARGELTPDEYRERVDQLR